MNFNSIWFRGQPNYEHKLIPSIFRQGNDYGVSFSEAKMFKEFQRRYPEQSTSHKTIYEWLTLMQHYGLPTRLLDWSSNLLVSLFFTCRSCDNLDGAVFVYDPTHMERDYKFTELLEMQLQVENRGDFFNRLIYKTPTIIDDESLLNGNRIGDIKKDIFLTNMLCANSTNNLNDLNSLQVRKVLYNAVDHNNQPLPFIHIEIKDAFSNIIPFKAPHLNARIRHQQGFFTFHGGLFIDGKMFIKTANMEEDHYAGSSLIKIKIPSIHKKAIINELKYTGIRESTLFPEMEYQAKDIKDMFSSIMDL